ncbi:hypothetical protein [Kitasatospora cinereorecta]|uniref:Uncharacterized protein n=1 Tax=Kitasatospora cinereorecta TaxID=285560 RepID=A0ABW0VJG3_9ACTN
MTPREDFTEDFGITGLTKHITPPYVPGDEAGCLDMAALLFEREGRLYAEEMLEDARCLVESSLSDGVLATVWLAATGSHFDPVGAGLGIRPWLRRIEGACLSFIRRDDPTFVPTAPGPAADPALRDAVLAELRGMAPALAEAAVSARCAPPLPAVVPALAAAVAELPADLGFRLFLRAVKTYFVPIGPARKARFKEIGRRLGYHGLVVGDGNLNVWSDLVD